MLFRRARAAVAQAAGRRNLRISSQRRAGGADDHPFRFPEHDEYVKPFGRKPGEPIKKEGWEFAIYFWMGLSVVTLIVGAKVSPRPSLAEATREKLLKEDSEGKYSLDKV